MNPIFYLQKLKINCSGPYRLVNTIYKVLHMVPCGMETIHFNSPMILSENIARELISISTGCEYNAKLTQEIYYENNVLSTMLTYTPCSIHVCGMNRVSAVF